MSETGHTLNSAESDDDRPLVSIIVPVYNEQDNITPTYTQLKSVTSDLTDFRFEFTFLDNRSSDGSFAKLAALAEHDENVRVVRFARNFGFQRSVLTGYCLANGDAAIQIDADLQDPPSMFGPFLEKWKEGHDVVVGIRRRRKEGRILHAMRRGYYWLMTKLDGDHLIRDAGDFRLVDRSILTLLRQVHEPHIYLRGLISSLSRNQVGIVYDREKREFGESKYGIMQLLSLAMDGILAHSSFPLRLSFYLGLLIAVTAMFLSGFYLIYHILYPAETPAGFTTTQLLILFGIGINAFFLGVVGIYIGRIYDHIRVRPLTIISDLINFDASIEDIGTSLNHEHSQTDMRNTTLPSKAGKSSVSKKNSNH